MLSLSATCVCQGFSVDVMGRRGMRIGLTGGIASGKSTVAQRFQELGVPVIDADESARRVVAPGTAGLTAVVRRALRNLIFSDPARRRELESILHPLIRADMKSRADASPGPYLVMAIPLLVEGGALHRVDRILVVDVPEDVQLKRVMGRDGATLEQAHSIYYLTRGPFPNCDSRWTGCTSRT